MRPSELVTDHLALVRHLWADRDAMGLTIIGLSVAMIGIVGLSRVAEPVEDLLLSRHQFTAGWLGHVALLPLASMYSYQHTLLVGPGPLDPAWLEDPERAPADWLAQEAFMSEPCGDGHGMVRGAQHFPAVWLPALNAVAARCDRPLDVALISTGSRARRVTVWRLTGSERPQPQGSP